MIYHAYNRQHFSILQNLVSILKAETDLQTWGLGAKVFLGAPSPQAKNCGWLIDWSIVVSSMVEYGLMASC